MTCTDSKIELVNVMGMELERWTYKSCSADFGVGNNWATLYSIESKDRNKGHATALLREAKNHYEKLGKTFGGTVALTTGMEKIYLKLGIKEYR